MANELHNAKFLQVTAPAAILDNASATTNEIDTVGWDYLTVVCSVGATDIAMAALKLQESDTSGSGHADITGADVDGGTDIDGNTTALPSATDDNGLTVFQVDLRGRKRYIDLVATAGDGTTGTYFSAQAILSRGDAAPTTSSAAGAQHLIRL